ncbi:hypothetical protein [Sphingomonas koreensis]
METHSLIERGLLMALGSFATLMAVRLSLISNVDLATKWVMAIMAVFVVLTIVLKRSRRAANNGS